MWVIRLARQKSNAAAQKTYPQLELIQSAVTGFLKRPPELTLLQTEAYQALGGTDLPRHLERTIHNRSLSYRDLALIQAAYAIRQPGLDTKIRPEGARTVAKRLSQFLRANHIRAVDDAYQNVGKNTDILVRGSDPDSDQLLTWMASAGNSEIKAVFDYICASIALSARAVRALPDLDAALLTFGVMVKLFDALLFRGSGGAYEQFGVAALLEALVEQTSAGVRVETKHLHATDKSSGTAGDVELRLGGRVLEAYEVTANHWESKIDGAVQKIRQNDLRRMHILANVPEEEESGLAHRLAALPVDISVLDLAAFVRTCLSALDKAHRRKALVRLYELLDRKQDAVQYVNDYVSLLEASGLTLSSS